MLHIFLGPYRLKHRRFTLFMVRRFTLREMFYVKILHVAKENESLLHDCAVDLNLSNWRFLYTVLFTTVL